MEEKYENFTESGERYWVNVFNIDWEFKSTVWDAF